MADREFTIKAPDTMSDNAVTAWVTAMRAAGAMVTPVASMPVMVPDAPSTAAAAGIPRQATPQPATTDTPAASTMPTFKGHVLPELWPGITWVPYYPKRDTSQPIAGYRATDPVFKTPGFRGSLVGITWFFNDDQRPLANGNPGAFVPKADIFDSATMTKRWVHHDAWRPQAIAAQRVADVQRKA